MISVSDVINAIHSLAVRLNSLEALIDRNEFIEQIKGLEVNHLYFVTRINNIGQIIDTVREKIKRGNHIELDNKKELAAFLGISRPCLDAWINGGIVPIYWGYSIPINPCFILAELLKIQKKQGVQTKK